MGTPEEKGRRRGSGGGYLAAPQHQESSTVFGYFSHLYPLNSVDSCLPAGDPGPEEAALTVGNGKPLRGSTRVEQAMEEQHFGPHNVVQRFDVSPDVYPYWHHQTSLFNNQEAEPHHDATRRHLNFDVEIPCHSYIPGSHDPYASHDHAGYSWGVPPSLPNFGHSHLSNGGLQESSSWQQIVDASNMPFHYPCDQLIQMPEDWKSSFVFSNPTGEVSDLVVYGQNGDGATNTQKRSSGENSSKSQDQERIAEPNSVTPRRGSKRKAESPEDGGCKRCNCRRSKCLKLYCECFAAGLYCIDSCTCEDCYNSLDFEDTVLEMRKQIESRNPLAFAPKIVQNGNDSPPDKAESSGSDGSTSSVRHIRGCNCRKSHCVKRYCDCFQANVGCSDECNCEDCWNPYTPKSAERRIERREMTPHGMPDSTPGMPDSIGTGTGGQSDSTCEGTVNMPNSTPSPSPSACSKHPSSRDCSSSTQAETYQGAVPPRLPHPPIGMPPSDGDKAPPHLVGVSITHHAVKGVNVSGTGTSLLSNPANASSPSQGQVSTLQFRRPSIISPSSRRARKPDSRTRPSSDSKSKGCSSEA